MTARTHTPLGWGIVLAVIAFGCGKSGSGSSSPDAGDTSPADPRDGDAASDTREVPLEVPDATLDETGDGSGIDNGGTSDGRAIDGSGDSMDTGATEAGGGVDGLSVREQFADPTKYLAIKQQLRFQTAAGASFYDVSADSIKRAWADWSDDRGVIPNKPDFLDALAAAANWLAAPDRFDNLQQPATAMSADGGGGESAGTDTATPYYYVPLAHAWQVFIWWTAHNVALEMAGALPWSVAGDTADRLAPLFDSTEMMHRRSVGDFQLGGAPHANYVGVPYASYLGATIIGAPRYTYRFLAREGILKSTRRATITALLDWVGANLVHFEGHPQRIVCQDHWGQRWNPAVEQLIEGTTRASDGKFAHWTLGCHGTTRFVKDVLRAANIPVRLAFNCEHSQLLFMSEDAYMTHGDHLYNSNFRSSGCSTDWLLLDRARWESLFGPGQVNHQDATLCNATPNPVAYSSLPEILATCR